MKFTTYYTVIIGKQSCTVQYAEGPDYSVKQFPETFQHPDEASQEFKIAGEGETEYLTKGAFLRKVELLSKRYKQDLVKLAAWNDGKAIRI